MSSLLSTRATRTSLLSLPPHLRTSTYLQTRPFSASPTRKLTLVDLAVAGPNAIITAIHSTGLPWYAALPTAALLVRGVLVCYISALPARRAARIQSNLVPLAAARAQWKTNSPEAKARRADQPNGVRALDRMFSSVYYRTMELHHLGKLFGASRFHPRGLINFGMLIAFTEAIRMRCGTREGLLPMLLSPLEELKKMMEPPGESAAAAGSTAAPTSGAVPATGASDAVMAVDPDSAASAASTVDLSQANPEALSRAYSAYFDPTLQSEGLSWCLDLTAPDPTFILPTALAIGMATNIIYRPTSASRAPPKQPTTSTTIPTQPVSQTQDDPASTPAADAEAQATLSAPPAKGPIERLLPPITNLQRLGLCVVMFFWFAALKMPAAILLYFVPSLMVGYLQRIWLEKKIRVVPPIQACRRPLRYRVRKEWND